jgi:hypothetical protein
MGSINKIAVQANPSHKNETVEKIAKTIRAGGVAQVIEPLCSKPKALSSNPGTTKGKETQSDGSLIFFASMLLITFFCIFSGLFSASLPHFTHFTSARGKSISYHVMHCF